MIAALSPLVSWALIVAVLGALVTAGYVHLHHLEKLDRMDEEWLKRQRENR